MDTSGETAALARLLRPLSRGMSAELARALINLRADEQTQARYDQLADKSTHGRLTPDERNELEAMVRANTVLGILKAEAQLAMAAS